MNKKDKRTQTINAILAGVIMLAGGLLAAGYGVKTGMGLLPFYCIFFFSFGAAILMQTAIHEAGHLVFGLLTGFRFLSYRILSLIITNEDGKLKCRRFSIPGTLGQCLMSAPLNRGKRPYFLYNAGGVIFNLISATLCCGLVFLLQNAYLKIFFIINGAYSLLMFFINSIPYKGSGIANDGNNIMEMRQHPAAIDAFYLMLDASEEMYKGARARDFSDERFDLKEETLTSGSLGASNLVWKENQLMDRHEFAQAEELLEKIFDNSYPLLGYHVNALKLDQKYLDCLDGRFEDTGDPALLKYIKASEKASVSVMRYLYARSLYLKEEKEAEKYLRSFERMKDSYPYPGEWQSEKELMDIAREKIMRGSPE